MVTKKVPLPPDSSPDASAMTSGEQSGISFTGEEAWLLFAKVKIKKRSEKMKRIKQTPVNLPVKPPPKAYSKHEGKPKDPFHYTPFPLDKQKYETKR